MVKDKGKAGSAAHAKPNRVAKHSKAQPYAVRKASNAPTHAERPLPGDKKPGHFRTKSKINILNMYNSKPDKAKMKKQPLHPARIQPDRRWFGNTRVITQTKLEEFRDTMEKARNDPYSVVLKRSKLPVSLFAPEQNNKKPRVNILSLEPFDRTFGKKQSRKRPRIIQDDISSLVLEAEKKRVSYSADGDGSALVEKLDPKDAVSQEIYKKGTSRRIWQELYKVVDSSDVIVQVIDARDPMGTRCKNLEYHIRKDRPNKHVILLMNKCDLVPAWCASRWVKILASEYPTVAFHSSLTNSFGKMTLLNLLRQYASLLKERKHVSVGFVGYPNVGKSSVINTLRMKNVCKAAPVPGETKVWQYVALTNRVHLIDCPGVVPSDPGDGDSDTAKVLKGVVRAERIHNPEEHVSEILNRVRRDSMVKRYQIPTEKTWENADDFLSLVAKRFGKLLKGGEPDISTAARIVIYDWQRGRLPYYVAPPYAREMPGAKNEDEGLEEAEEAEEKQEEEKDELEAPPQEIAHPPKHKRGDKRQHCSASPPLS